MDEYLTREDAANFLGISTRTLDRYVQRKIIKPRRRGRRMMFLRTDLDALANTHDPVSQVIRGDTSLSLEQAPQFSTLVGLAQEMHREIQKKDQEIAHLHFELGKYQEIAKNSIPLLESSKRDYKNEDRVKNLTRELTNARLGKHIFLSLFGIALGAIGVLIHYLSLLN